MVVAIIAVLVGILMPALSAARRRTRLTRCAANLREIFVQVRMYADSQDGYMPRGPEPLHEFDFASNRFATNQVWIGDTSGKPPQYNGLGAALRVMRFDREILFCPSDDNLNEADELPKIETNRDAYGSYLYRQLDHLPNSARKGKLDSLGVNRIAGIDVRVEALALDMNSYGDGEYFHTNHRGDRVNILFQRGDIETFSNYEGYFAIAKDEFVNPSGIPAAIDQLLTNADFARDGNPAEAPRLTE